MSRERFAQRQREVLAAAARLAEAVAAPQTDLSRDGVIKRFEFTFDLAWKTLNLYLERQGHECGGPRPTLKKAFAEGLIQTPDDADVWLQMLEDRNLTSHAYDEALAASIHHNIVTRHAPRLSAMAQQLQSLAWD
jgi:nucleotidyltransferase substrate binding protein (TIGR01987 family)